jgi:hypothetical protein
MISGLLAAVGDHFVTELLPFPQRAESGPLDGGNVHEHIFAAIIGLDKSKTLLGVKPFDDSDSH